MTPEVGGDHEKQETTSGPAVPRQVLPWSGKGSILAGRRRVCSVALYLPRATAPFERGRTEGVDIHAHPRRPALHLLSDLRRYHARRRRRNQGYREQGHEPPGDDWAHSR